MTNAFITAHGITGILGKGLAPRELQCLIAVAVGMTSKEAAKDLGLAPNTVDKRLLAATTKMGVTRRAALVAEAFKRGVIAFACGAPTPGPQHHQDSDDHQGIFIA